MSNASRQFSAFSAAPSALDLNDPVVCGLISELRGSADAVDTLARWVFGANSEVPFQDQIIALDQMVSDAACG